MQVFDMTTFLHEEATKKTPRTRIGRFPFSRFIIHMLHQWHEGHRTSDQMQVMLEN